MKANVEVMEKIVIVCGVFVSEFSVLRPNKNEISIALNYYKRQTRPKDLKNF